MAANRTVFCLAAATTFFGVFCAVLVGLLVWREFYVDRAGGQDQGYRLSENATIIQQMFPGYFRTETEQEAFERPYLPSMVEVYNVSKRYQQCYMATSCPDTTTLGPTFYTIGPNSTSQGNRRRRRQISTQADCSLDFLNQTALSFHACCITSVYFENPTTLPDVDGNPVQIAQFPQIGLSQYFQVHRCCQAANCYFCRCSQTITPTSAVTVDPRVPGVFKVKLVQVRGCCQCININAS